MDKATIASYRRFYRDQLLNDVIPFWMNSDLIDRENGFVWHNGGTGDYNSYLGFCEETKTAVVVLSNLAPSYKIPATVLGLKKLQSLQ